MVAVRQETQVDTNVVPSLPSGRRATKTDHYSRVDLRPLLESKTYIDVRVSGNEVPGDFLLNVRNVSDNTPPSFRIAETGTYRGDRKGSVEIKGEEEEEGAPAPAPRADMWEREVCVYTATRTHQAIHHRAQDEDRPTASAHYFRFAGHEAARRSGVPSISPASPTTAVYIS